MSPEDRPPEEGEESEEEARANKRRKFINLSLGVSFTVWCGSALYPVTRYMFPPEGPTVEDSSVKVGLVSDFANSSGTLFRMGNKPGILIRTETGEFHAFIAICTHLDCTVQFKEDEGIIWCACHNGKYNLRGANIAGPPPRPLDALEVALKGDEVYVSLPA